MFHGIRPEASDYLYMKIARTATTFGHQAPAQGLIHRGEKKKPSELKRWHGGWVDMPTASVARAATTGLRGVSDEVALSSRFVPHIAMSTPGTQEKNRSMDASR